MTGCCSWCGRESDDLVECPTQSDRGRIQWWCKDDVACQAARSVQRPVLLLRIPPAP